MDLHLTKPMRWPYLLLIAAIHTALFFALTDKTAHKKASESSSALVVLLIPSNASVTTQKKNTPDVVSKPLIKKEKIAKTQAALIPDKTAVIVTENQITPSISTSPTIFDKGLNTDITNIAKGLKTDFETRDRVTLKPAASPMSKLGQKIAAAATTQREGYHEERLLLGDGRPVTKVITPYGTYCILHRKPGEIIGNALAAVPVTCDNL